MKQLALFEIPKPVKLSTKAKVYHINRHLEAYGKSIKQICLEAKAKYERGELYK